MKKHNEGYSMVLVLVVLTVLGLIAAFILSFSLQNLQAQEASAERMQDQYKAAGEIEKVVAQLEAQIRNPSAEGVMIENAEIVEEDPVKLRITASSEMVQIDCVFVLSGAYYTSDEENKKVTIKSLTGFEYVSYDISTVGGDG